jgi:hypothetical protein
MKEKYKQRMQEWFNGLLKSSDIFERLADISEGIDSLDREQGYVDQGTQLLLKAHYQQLADRGVVLPFSDVGFRNHSQSEEDGILWYLFSLIGVTNRLAVEVCAGDGRECNSANLILNHGWDALLVDGNKKNIRVARDFYRRHRGSFLAGPTIVQGWVSAENINEIVESNGYSGDIDLLTIDVDGIDYWLWKALDVASPRVVAIESNLFWFIDRPVTVKYTPDFRAKWIKIPDELREHPDFLRREGFFSNWVVQAGASLPALVKLAEHKGYRLVGTSRHFYNAFFVRNDVAADILPEVTMESCYPDPRTLAHHRLIRSLIEEFEWEDV